MSASSRNPYHVLGLKKGATEQQIREAYKVLARVHHPDRNLGDPGAQGRFIEIKEAYESLIEKKTSSSALQNVVEEKSAHLQRRGVFRNIAIGLGVIAGTAAIAGGGLTYYPRWNFDQGQRAAVANDLSKAKSLLEPIARGGGPHASKARNALALAWMRDRKPSRADSAAAARALLQNATDPLGLALLGDLDLLAGDVPKARSAWSRARDAAGNTAEIHARTWAGLIAAGDSTGAAAVLAKAERTFPKDPWITWMLGMRALRTAKLDEAAEDFPEGVKTAVGKLTRAAVLISQVRNDRAGVLSHGAQERVGEALRLLDEASDAVAAGEGRQGGFGYPYPIPPVLVPRDEDWIPSTATLDPRVAILLTQAAAASLQQNDVDFARFANQATGLDGAFAPALLTRGNALLFAGNDNLNAAKGAFESVLLIPPRCETKPDRRCGAAQAGLARVHGEATQRANMAREEMARLEIDAWRKAQAYDPTNPEYAYGLAMTWGRLGRPSERILADKHALQLAPGFTPARIDLASALLAQGNESAALAELERATASPITAAQAWVAIGEIHYGRNRHPAALAAFERATLSGVPKAMGHAWFRIMCIHSLARREKEGKDAYRQYQAIPVDGVPRQLSSEPALAWLFPKLALRRDRSPPQGPR